MEHFFSNIEKFFPCLQSSEPREGFEGEEDEDDSIGALVRNSFICFIFFIICVVIASIVAATIITSYNVVTAVEDEVEPVPFRVVNHGIWPGYRHEFFSERVPYLKAEQICISRNKSSLLHFNSQEQEDKFDMYASLNFWSDTDYPAFQLWTSGFVLAKRLERGNKIIWPEPNRRGELQEIRECGVRGEGLVNAFGTSEMYWQERHIIKDYIQGNQPEISKVGGDTGCWQHIKRNDIAPDRFYEFVCQKKI